MGRLRSSSSSRSREGTRRSCQRCNHHHHLVLSVSFANGPRRIYIHHVAGVGARGVVKSHYCIIYCGDRAPEPRAEERPRRVPNGQIETPMKSMAIRVTQ